MTRFAHSYEFGDRRYTALRLPKCLFENGKPRLELVRKLEDLDSRLRAAGEKLKERQAAERPWVRSVLLAKRVVTEAFPEYWLPIEAVISVAATLSLKDNANPVALFFTGPAASGKSTTNESAAKATRLYLSDKFTPASFVSQHARAVEDPLTPLNSVDLLPKIRYKLLITPELAPMFRKDPAVLKEHMSIVARVMDGRGLTVDAGTHGRRGYTGDYLFAWIGATTPLTLSAWRVLLELGSRLLFYEMPQRPELSEAEVVNDILTSDSYKDRFDKVQAFVSEAVDALPARRSVAWPQRDPPEAVTWIVRLARLLAEARPVTRESVVTTMNMSIESFTSREDYRRCLAQLLNIARGRALMYGRYEIDAADLAIVADIVFSSLPEYRGQILRLLANSASGLSIAELARGTGLAHVTVETKLKELAVLGIIELRAHVPDPLVLLPPGRPPARLVIPTPAFSWLLGAATHLYAP